MVWHFTVLYWYIIYTVYNIRYILYENVAGDKISVWNQDIQNVVQSNALIWSEPETLKRKSPIQ